MAKIPAILAWLLITLFSAAGTCALCGAFTPWFLAGATVFFGMFFSFLLLSPESD